MLELRLWFVRGSKLRVEGFVWTEEDEGSERPEDKLRRRSEANDKLVTSLVRLNSAKDLPTGCN